MDSVTKAKLIISAGNMWLDPSVIGTMEELIFIAAQEIGADLSGENMTYLVTLVNAYVDLRIKANQRQDIRW
jgi:hypothetical protein